MAVRADDVDLTRDRSLVESCQAGDPTAFADLYNRYYQRLYRFCLRRVHSPHEAEEVTQEAFARAFTAMPRFAGERRFYPWLSVIAARLCVDSHRRDARSEPSAEIDLGGVEGGQQRVIDDVDRELLTRALDNLGPRHREVLHLRETDGWSYQQIADHYEVSMGTVEALLFRARKALRREFLAIAGDGGRLVALPVVGIVASRLGVWRARLHAWVDHLTPTVAAASAAAVMAVVGGVSVAGHDGATSTVNDTAKPVAVRAAAAPSVEDVANPPGLADGPSSTATAGIAPQPAPRPSLGAQAVKPLSQGSAAEGHRRSAGDSTTITVAGVTVSTDLSDSAPISIKR